MARLGVAVVVPVAVAVVAFVLAVVAAAMLTVAETGAARRSATADPEWRSIRQHHRAGMGRPPSAPG